MPKIHANGHTTNAGQDASLAAPAPAEDAPAPGNVAAGEAVASGELEVIRPRRKTKEDQ